MKLKYIRKSAVSIFIAAIILLSSISYAWADLSPVYDTSTTETITSGATLQNITRFTRDGWLKIHVLKVDLTNPNINIDSLSNLESISKLTTTKKLAEARGAVAAVNSGFFSWGSKSGIGNPIGTSVESGKIVSISPEFDATQGGKFSTLMISRANELLYQYLKTEITLTAADGTPIQVSRLNKQYAGHKDFTILDPRWSRQTLGVENSSSDLVEMLIDNGQVVEIRQSQPSTQMPANGYEVVTRSEGGQLLLEHFKVGDPVQLNITTTPDWSNIKTSITGGAMLVINGQIPETFSHIPEGTRSTRNPRTALGSTPDGKQLFLVTVDGRQEGSVGMNLTELAQFMQEIGANNAINLDGGGSTTMVARSPLFQALEVVNDPSDGSSRRVSTALGVFSIAPPSPLNKLVISTEDDNVFVNTSRSFTVRGYDRYSNPVEIDPLKVKWSVSGLQGVFKDSTFYPKSVGAGAIKARYGNITAKLEISSLSSPVQLFLNTGSLNLPVKGKKSFTIEGKNKNGYYASISPEDLKWRVSGKVGTIENGAFTATAPGSGYIDCSLGSTHAYCSVSVLLEKTKGIDSFEALKGSFLPYPASVEGSFEISAEQKREGNSSGKLTYKFLNAEGTRAAYLTYSNEGLPMDPDTKKIGLWVYNTTPSSSWLAASFIDANGKQHIVYFVKSMDWTGWKYLEAPLTGVDAGSKLTRLYVVQPNPVIDEGTLFFDDLTLITAAYPKIDESKIPKDTVPKDAANVATSFKASKSSLRFTVFGQDTNPLDPLKKALMSKLTLKLKKNYDLVSFVGNSKEDASKVYKKPYLSTSSGYKAVDLKGNTFIQLDISKGGLRKTDPEQWPWLLKQLESTKSKNVFLFLAGPPSSFEDEKEGALLKNILRDYKKTTRKSVWVFYNGKKNDSIMINGIKYISTPGLNVEGLTPKTKNLAKYIVVTVKGSSITYEFKPME